MGRKRVREYFDFYIDINQIDFYALAETLIEHMVSEEDLFDIYSHNKKSIIPFNVISKLSKDEIELLKVCYIVEKKEKEHVFYINNIDISSPKMNDFLKLGYFNYFVQDNDIDLKKSMNIVKTNSGKIVHLDNLMDQQDMQYKRFNHAIYLLYLKNPDLRKKMQYFMVQSMKYRYLQYKRECYKEYLQQKLKKEKINGKKQISFMEKIISFFKKKDSISITTPIHSPVKPKILPRKIIKVDPLNQETQVDDNL